MFINLESHCLIIFVLHLMYFFILVSVPFPGQSEHYHPYNCTPTYYKFALLEKNHRFLIHGLWPEGCQECDQKSCQNQYPTFCQTNRKYNSSRLRPLAKEILANYFPNSPYQENLLMKHEWLKHGTCTNMTELTYFNRTITLYHRFNRTIHQLCNPKNKNCYLNLNPDQVH